MPGDWRADLNRPPEGTSWACRKVFRVIEPATEGTTPQWACQSVRRWTAAGELDAGIGSWMREIILSLTYVASRDEIRACCAAD